MAATALPTLTPNRACQAGPRAAPVIITATTRAWVTRMMGE
ncbi:hypothetical protein [Acidaminococcus timonensis]